MCSGRSREATRSCSLKGDATACSFRSSFRCHFCSHLPWCGYSKVEIRYDSGVCDLFALKAYLRRRSIALRRRGVPRLEAAERGATALGSGKGASDARAPFQFILEIRSARVANFLRGIVHGVLDMVDRDDRVRTSIRMRRWVARPPNQWLKEVKGLVHIGANTGQEVIFYDWLGLIVLWIEPIPEAFAELTRNISCFPKQSAVEALITDKVGQSYQFNVSGGTGQASSIFDFAGHKEIWPDVEVQRVIDVQSTTLDTVLRGRRTFDGLVMDTQGSELLVLQGAEASLSQFRYIKTEAADFERYRGQVLEPDLTKFIEARGFELVRKDPLALTSDKRGRVSDLLFRRVNPPPRWFS